MKNPNSLQRLSQVLRQRAEQILLAVEENPAALARDQLPAQQLLAVDANTPKEAGSADLTPSTPGMYLGKWSVLFGSLDTDDAPPPSLPADREAVIERWRRFQKRAAIARMTLDARRQDDLVLFLVGPVGSDQDKEWITLASQIERDDLVCRKLVWLPPTSAETYQLKLEAFLGRTFLARPWTPDGEVNQPRLDAANEPDAASDTLAAWEGVLGRQPQDEANIDYDELAKALIETYQP